MRLLWGLAAVAGLLWAVLAFQDDERAQMLGQSAGALAVVLGIVGLVLLTSRRT